MNATNIFLFRGTLGAIQTSGYFLIFYSHHRFELYREPQRIAWVFNHVDYESTDSHTPSWYVSYCPNRCLSNKMATRGEYGP